MIKCPKCGSNAFHMVGEIDLEGEPQERRSEIWICEDCGTLWLLQYRLERKIQLIPKEGG